MNNILTAAEIKRRGMAIIEERLRRGPVHILKRNKAAAVVLTEEDYQRLTGTRPAGALGLSAVQWLLAQAPQGARDKNEIDADLGKERDW